MDRTLKNQSGFSLVELIVVVAVVGILSALTFTHFDRLANVNSVNDDIHKILSFIQTQKMFAFTQKQEVQITVAGNQVTTIIDPAGAAVAGPSLTCDNALRAAGSPFTVNTRGFLSVAGGGGGGDISVNAVNTGAEYSCIVLDNIRLRLGEWDGANCTTL